MCMRKLFRKKLKSKRGFTLGETLLAVLILLMVSTIVASGIPSAKNAYEKVVLASNAEVLLSTTISSLRNELSTAKNIVIDGTTITYFNETRGSTSMIYLNANSPNTIMLQRYVETDGLGINSTPVRLVSESASTNDLYVTYGPVVSYSNGIITFNNLSVDRESGRTGLATRDALSIRVISDKHST